MRESAFIIEATFAGKASVGAMPSTIRVVTTGSGKFGEEEAKHAINSLWYIEGHDIKDDEWENISITLVDVPFMEYEKLMEQLTLHEIEYLYEYFCAKYAEDEDDILVLRTVNRLRSARYALYQELAHGNGYQFKMQ
jgi:hypothetical protein